MNMHYYCQGGCGGHSGAPATCHAEGCPKKGEPFTSCDCGDEGSHAKAKPEPEPKDENA